MHGPVAEAWFEIEEPGGSRRRVDVAVGRTVLGGPGDAVVVAAAGTDRLHVWDEPARLVFVGDGTPPTVDGEGVEERALSVGDRIEWHGFALVFRRAARLEEEAPVAPPKRAKPEASATGEGRLWRRVKAGLLVELGLVDAARARPWQERVRSGEFEPDKCAKDLLAAAGDESVAGPLAERTARLQRDLLMAPLQSGARGAGRRARAAAKRGLAYAVAQLVVLLIFLALVMIGLLVARLMLDWSIDEFLDGIGGVFGAGG